MSKSGAPNIFDAFNFFDIQNRQLVAGYDMLRNLENPGSARQVVLVGLLVVLGSMNEGTDVACRLNPRLETVRAKFAQDLRRWYRLRNDVAHVFDRVFSPPRKGQNIPWLPGGLSIGTYIPETDTVSTGGDPNASVALWDAIQKSFELTTLLQLVNDDEISESEYGDYSIPVEQQIDRIRTELLAKKQAASSKA
jgi:hypothetical protein